jgi:hypothetical protein
VTARQLDTAAEEIRGRRRRMIEAAALAAVTAALCAAASVLGSPLAVALGTGAAFEAAVALHALVARRTAIARLALDPAAYELEEVRRYGARLTRPRQRAVLAEGIRSMIRDAFNPSALYLGDRVVRYARELDGIARDLLAPGVRVHPVSVARCRALLTEAAESPLYNPKLPADDLAILLRRIRAGIEKD